MQQGRFTGRIFITSLLGTPAFGLMWLSWSELQTGVAYTLQGAFADLFCAPMALVCFFCLCACAEISNWIEKI